MERRKQLQMSGYLAFFLMGICAMSTGIIVNRLQERYGFSYSVAGTLLSMVSVGNMAAAFLAGMLPGRIGRRMTVTILCSGFFLGFLITTLTGSVGALMAAFLMIGLTRGATINTSTVLVGENSRDRSRDLVLMHCGYAIGALLCPFLVNWSGGLGIMAPMYAMALIGLLLWVVFQLAKLPGKPAAASGKTREPMDFLRQKRFWLLTGMIFCQNAAEISVTGWLVTYFQDQKILTGTLSTYTLTIMWVGALIARLIIAFVLRIRDRFKTLAVMGLSCFVLYGAMMFADRPVSAACFLFAFSAAMAGVNPLTVAATGTALSPAGMGILLPLGASGAVLMPWIIGQVADAVNLRVGMVCNLAPCLGILILSLILRRMDRKEAAL